MEQTNPHGHGKKEEDLYKKHWEIFSKHSEKLFRINLIKKRMKIQTVPDFSHSSVCSRLSKTYCLQTEETLYKVVMIYVEPKSCQHINHDKHETCLKSTKSSTSKKVIS